MKKQNKGFSLIELVVSVSIMSILMVIAVPSYSIWMAKLKMQSTTESVNLGIIQARAEAIRRNSLVNFNVNANSSWSIVDSISGATINKRTSDESSNNTTLTITGSMLTYNGLGLLSPNIDGSSSITNIEVKSNLNSTIPALRVVVGSGGSSIVCDTGSSSPDLMCRSQ